MNWHLVILALCFAFLLEGILLFIAPAHFRASAAKLLQLDDNTLRIIGLVVMLSGLGLMVVVSA